MTFKTILISFLFLFASVQLLSQETSILKVHFYYGSKPKRGHKAIEGKYFGGLHGGHVTIEIDNEDFGFGPNGRLHLFAHRKSLHGGFGIAKTNGEPPYPEGDQFVTFEIPITNEQKTELKAIMSEYLENTPYDYAFFGMRCAAATHDILGEIGIVKDRSNFGCIVKSFYPKRLRKRMFKYCLKRNYKIIKQKGRVSRKWEKDRFFK